MLKSWLFEKPRTAGRPLALRLLNIISCPLFVARSAYAMCGGSAAFVLRELTGIRLRRRFASLEMG